MNDRMTPVILQLAGTCTRCGRVRCANPAHFQAALDIRWEPPVISAQAAAELLRRLTGPSGRGRIARERAARYIALHYRVVA